jgi:hypothetical protein
MLTLFKNFFANNTYLNGGTHADIYTWFSIDTILIFVIFVIILLILYFWGDVWQYLEPQSQDSPISSQHPPLPDPKLPPTDPSTQDPEPAIAIDKVVEKESTISGGPSEESVFNSITNLTITDWTWIGGSLLVIGLGIYYYPAICAWSSAYYNSFSWSSRPSPSGDAGTSDTSLINHNLGISRENLEAIEAQLERVTTVADKLDETLKNLNVTLDKTNIIFKSSTDASANLIIATDQVNTNLGVINKAAEFTNGAVVRIGRLCDRLFSIHKATQTVESSPDLIDTVSQFSDGLF